MEPMQERERESGCFSGAGLSNTDNIATAEHCGDGLLLNGSGNGVTLSSHGAHERFGEPEIFEIHERSWVKMRNIPRTQRRETTRRNSYAGDSNAWCWQPFRTDAQAGERI
jgi:hypothetical protein